MSACLRKRISISHGPVDRGDIQFRLHDERTSWIRDRKQCVRGTTLTNAAAPVECYEKMSIRAAKNIVEALDGVLDPGFVVNPETLPNRRNA